MDDITKKQIVEALHGSHIGAIVACALGVSMPNPCYTSKAIITSDGFVQANFVDQDGVSRHMAFVGSYDDEVLGALRNASKYLRKVEIIDEAQSTELWQAVAYDWIVTDYRN